MHGKIYISQWSRKGLLLVEVLTDFLESQEARRDLEGKLQAKELSAQGTAKKDEV